MQVIQLLCFCIIVDINLIPLFTVQMVAMLPCDPACVILLRKNVAFELHVSRDTAPLLALFLVVTQ